MSIEFEAKRGPSGEILQSAFPKQLKSTDSPLKADGLLVRGVVTATYAFDALHPSFFPNATIAQQAIYCDVLGYSGMSGNRTIPLRGCLVIQTRSGLHEGDLWKPRATTQDISGGVLNLNSGTDPANMDGDHVLVGFMDDDLTMPVIVGSIPHPSSDFGGVTTDAPGNRLRVYARDGEPRMWRHRGSFFGIDTSGNYIIDLTGANNGVYVSGIETPSGSANFDLKLPTNSNVTITGAKNLKIVGSTDVSIDSGTIELGAAAANQAVVNGTYWEAQRATRDTVVLEALAQIVGTLSGAVSALNIPPAASAPIVGSALAAILAPLQAAFLQFQSAVQTYDTAASSAPTFLSTTVTTKP